MKKRTEDYVHVPSPLNYEQFQLWGADLELSSGSNVLPEILFVTSYPPRECGIATYSQDLLKALANKFDHSFDLSICALESSKEMRTYEDTIKYVLNTDEAAEFASMAATVNADTAIKLLVIQHEFGFFQKHQKEFVDFLHLLQKPFVLVFHTVLPSPDETLLLHVQEISRLPPQLL